MLGLSANTAMASGTVFVAVFLGLWQWFDRRARDVDEVDRIFFQRQDIRRLIGIGMMLLLAVAIFLVDTSESSLSPQTIGQFGQLINLFGMIALIIGLLALALVDAMATMRYARRHRRELSQEHAKLMLEVIRRTGSSDSIPRVSEKNREAPRI
jgi:ABC-type multidrug transport system fused ATPase/permease subunit